MLVCAGYSETIAPAVPIGVGLVEASIGLTKLCLRGYVENLIFVGSAGSYAPDLSILSLCVSSRATQIESGLISGACYTPLDNCIESVSQETFPLESPYTRNVVVNSSNYITTDSRISTEMYRAGISVENMEFFAVLRVAKEFAIPAYGVFCITNYCDADAHKDFLQNHSAAKKKLEHFIQAQHL